MINVRIVSMLFFAFLVCIIPISFAEEDTWERTSLESKYFVHFQAQTRSADGSLVNVVETLYSHYLSDSRTDLAYSQLPLVDASTEILNKKYEMRQLVIPMGSIPSDSQGYKHNIVPAFNIGYEIDGGWVAVFHTSPPFFLVEYSDIVTVQWTIFKKI